MPRVPRAFCLIAMAMRFFSARVSLLAASIFLFTSGCSRRASSRFSARVPMPSSLDTCSSLCRFVMESVPIRTCKERISEMYVSSYRGSSKLLREPVIQAQSILHNQSKCTSLSHWLHRGQSLRFSIAKDVNGRFGFVRDL